MHYFHLFSGISDHLESIIVAGGYPFLFFTVLLEGLPLIGTIVPGHIAIIVSGFLAKIGILNLGAVLAISLIAAIIGDSIGFFLGRKYGLSLIDRLRPYFFITEEHIAKANRLLDKHTGKSMIIGRFSPVTRALMPFLVGASSISTGKFWLYNIIGAVGWVWSSVFLGYIFGAGYHAVAGYLGKFIVFAILTSLLIIWGYRFVNVRFHIFRRYELFTLTLNVLSLWGLAQTFQMLTNRTFRLSFDVWVNVFMSALNSSHEWSPTVVLIATLVTNIGSAIVCLVLGLLIALYYAFRRRWRSAGIMFLSVVSTALITGMLKDFFLVARPQDSIITMLADDYGFPSGHASMAAAFFVIIAYMCARTIHSRTKRELAIVACVLAIIAIGLSRLVLNVHWASDVTGGWSLGIFCATASILFVRYVSVLLVKKTG
jgi:undecaprenyl-diphosphatase